MTLRNIKFSRWKINQPDSARRQGTKWERERSRKGGEGWSATFPDLMFPIPSVEERGDCRKGLVFQFSYTYSLMEFLYHYILEIYFPPFYFWCSLQISNGEHKVRSSFVAVDSSNFFYFFGSPINSLNDREILRTKFH